MSNAILTGLLTQKQVSEILAVPARTLEQMRYQRRGPAFIHVGHAVRYKLSDLNEYVERNTIRPERRDDPR
jgi:Helix-turn-helix domain